MSFRQVNNVFLASIAINEVTKTNIDYVKLSQEGAKIYKKHIQKLISLKNKSEILKKQKQKVPARLMWKFGDTIFQLVESLKNKNLEPENLYESLCRDLGLSRTTIKRAIILRRYVDSMEAIPKDLNWSACKDAAKRFALSLNGRRTSK